MIVYLVGGLPFSRKKTNPPPHTQKIHPNLTKLLPYYLCPSTCLKVFFLSNNLLFVNRQMQTKAFSLATSEEML
jgi:hypothetical protein